MVYFLKPRIGFIGAGEIAHQHIQAAMNIGFEVDFIAAKSNSDRLKELCKKFNIRKTFIGIENINLQSTDALSIITSAESLFEVYNYFESYSIPILIEKPLFTDIQQLENFNLSRVDTLVGFNRRFYPSVIKLKKEVQNLKSINGMIRIPELTWAANISNAMRRESIMFNAIHILDLINHLFGDYTEIKSIDTEASGDYSFLCSLILYANHNLVNLTVSFGVPDTYSLQVLTENKRFELSPIEELNVYDHMDFEAPTELRSYKKYQPKGIYDVTRSESDIKVKPGFLGMYQKFIELVTKNSNADFPSLNDAKNALLLGDRLIRKLEVF